MPATPATVTVALAIDVVPKAVRHETVVPVVHDAVWQSAPPTVPVGVASYVANASPLSVAVAPPLIGRLRAPAFTKLTAGARCTRLQPSHYALMLDAITMIAEK